MSKNKNILFNLTVFTVAIAALWIYINTVIVSGFIQNLDLDVGNNNLNAILKLGLTFMPPVFLIIGIRKLILFYDQKHGNPQNANIAKLSFVRIVSLIIIISVLFMGAVLVAFAILMGAAST